MHKKSTILMFSLSAIAVLLAIGIFVFMFRAIENKNTHTSKVLMILDQKMTEKENMSAIDKRLSEVEATDKSVKGYFVDSQKIDVFVGYLENMGAENKTDLSVASLDVSASNKRKVSFKLKIKGAFSDVMQTISVLENAPYQINITQVSLNKELSDIAPAPDPKNKNTKAKTTQKISWRADVSFSILKS